VVTPIFRLGVVLIAVSLLMGGVAAASPDGPPAHAAAAPEARAVDDSCPAGDVPEDGFNDIADGAVHEGSIDCVVWWGVSQGTSAPEYSPAAPLTRAQMASLTARLIETTGGSLPPSDTDHFDDDDGSVHEDNINRLASAGVVQGTGERTFGPNVVVNRGQLASLLVRAYELRSGNTLPAGDDFFPDDDDSVHEENIDKAAQAGLTGGRADGTYGPVDPVRRDQVASFLARTLDLLVEDGLTAAPPPGTSTILVAGDIAACTEDGDERTAPIVAGQAGTVLIAGDNAYESGSLREYEECYDPSWGQFFLRTRPVPGNHEYQTPDAAGYFDYFGDRAGERGKGWYSYDLGRWHVVALNSECARIGGCDAGSEQEQWLRADLAAHPNLCTLAYWHRPRFSSGEHDDEETVAPLWQALYDAGADLVLQGHDHDYERFAPLDASGAIDVDHGIKSFVVGTGGRQLRGFTRIHDTSEVRDSDTFGVLRVELAPDGYSWEFLPEPGSAFTDTGTVACHT
jgi:hypothetical protein